MSATKKSGNISDSGALRQTNEVQAAIDYGIDVQALIDNLKRTPEERVIRHQIALNAMEALQKAKHQQTGDPDRGVGANH